MSLEEEPKIIIIVTITSILVTGIRGVVVITNAKIDDELFECV